MNSTDRVAVVIPAFNPGPFLAEALASLLKQSFTNWHAVVVDDGSTESLAWVNDVDPRVELCRQQNQGVSVARNTGIARTSDPLIAFLDADDIWLPDKLAAQVSEMQTLPDLGLLSTDFEMINPAGIVTGEGYKGHHASYDDLLRGNGICLSTVMISRSALTGVTAFDPTLRTAQDWDLWLRIARKAPVGRLDRVLVQYRQNPTGLSSNWRRTWVESKIVLRRHNSPLAEVGLARLDELAAYQAFDAARAAVYQRQYASAASALGFVALHKPGILARALFRVR